MKSTGAGLFVVGAILVAIGVIWGATGFYLSQAPVLIFLLIAGLGLMWGGSRLNRDKNPNKSVAWKPEGDIPDVPATAREVAPPAAVEAPVAPVAVDEATRVVSRGIPRAWTLTEADGTAHLLGSRALLGRDPAQGDGPAAVLIALTADGSISKTHASVRVDDTGLWVTDLSSTNGTVVLTPAGVEVECVPGSEVAVPNGSTVEIGTYALKVSA